jgi:hypothetical protein
MHIIENVLRLSKEKKITTGILQNFEKSLSDCCETSGISTSFLNENKSLPER